ncbi:hypothetical protein [Aneurinibacillus migulanus]|uniref:hypothetical protein n=1 Tax=Aneurinibacillus migulanus TaxID=47500 RepID=UPI0013792B77|nr:hypothetical protein [Aneurinibacillus migulanus]
MNNFFRAGAWRCFAESTVPNLVKAIKELTDEVRRANDLKEREMDQKKREGD